MSNSPNPFAPPKSETVNEPKHDIRKYQLATRGQRLMGSIIDGVVMLVVAVPVYIGLYALVENFYPSLIVEPQTLAVFVVEEVVLLTICAVIFLAINGVLLAQKGQTIGKAALRMRIVSNRDELKPLLHIFLMRYLLLWILVGLPVIGRFVNLINALCIFRSNRKCLHDEWAGTKVVSLSALRTQRELPDKIEIPDYE